MAKALIRYFLFFCILLFNGNSFVYAHANQSCIPVKALKNLAYASFGNTQNSPTSIIKSDKATENDDLNALFVDDDDDDSFKKHLEGNTYYTSVSQTFGYFFSYNKNTLPYNKYFFYTSSYQYLIQVFRL